jgi:ketosteroid isomerase-like protein
MTHPNVDALRRNDEAMARGDLEEFFGFYTEDVAMHISGSSKLAGDYKGRDQLQELFGRFMDAIGDYSFENHAYLADDEHGVVLQKSKASRGGETFEVDEIFVFHFRDGQVSEMWYTPLDQAAFDRWIG